ncbi:MAG TPA: hypothetical protein V6C58_28845 [Allocoleopsis sp.]
MNDISEMNDKIREVKDDLWITLYRSTNDEIRKILHHKRFAEIFMVNKAMAYLRWGQYEHNV